MGMSNFDSLLYSRGKYWLFEHWQEDGKNIYRKAKFEEKEQFLVGAGKVLSEEQLVDLESGKSITIKQEDGTTLFFKYVDV
ncbi:TPA: hypothetical protein OUD70_001565 [Acinetobacter baumannii]|nr:hypothetical protein [Acinetobacter baumannii]MBP4719566.1 hypothetical protein [Acinetobacter baumannii]MCJ9200786.1 hypothetical protein [Acinetobacter baumannii]MCJ9353818.1 hypothetical protein [Acinetobacter baumannii]HAV3549941.1 hypothetical protein [Acinetobacter baumannii]